MSHWSVTDARVIALPSGRLIRGRGLQAHPEMPIDPEFGLYLLATPIRGVPWSHESIEWADFGLPTDPVSADRAITVAWQHALTDRVEVACMGGLGRTGTALACLATLDGLSPAAAIDHVRAAYDPRAIETPEQADYVARFVAVNGIR